MSMLEASGGCSSKAGLEGIAVPLCKTGREGKAYPKAVTAHIDTLTDRLHGRR